jgi:hypothetical protein
VTHGRTDPDEALPLDDVLVAWRREADYWQKRIERSDDQAAGMLTACLTAGGVGAAAAGYVQDRAPGVTSMVIVGLVFVVLAGLLTMGSRTFLAGFLGRRFDDLPRDRGHAAPPKTGTRTELVKVEQRNTRTMAIVAIWRERLVGAALVAWTIGVVLIAIAGFTAL